MEMVVVEWVTRKIIKYSGAEKLTIPVKELHNLTQHPVYLEVVVAILKERFPDTVFRMGDEMRIDWSQKSRPTVCVSAPRYRS